MKTIYQKMLSIWRFLRQSYTIKKSGLFDRGYYKREYQDVARSKFPPLFHFLRYGAVERRNPSEQFDTKFYLETYPDVTAGGMNPLLHFLRYGKAEKRNPAEWFDTAFYVNAYPDVAESGMNPLLHYLRYGKAEGRKCKEPEPDPVPLTPRKAALLIFDHNLGGGAWTYLYDKLINISRSQQTPVILLVRCNPYNNTYFVEVKEELRTVEKAVYPKSEKLFEELTKSNYSAIVVNNLFMWPSVKNVLGWIADYKKSDPCVSVEFKGHDYYSICPSFTLQDESHRYCGIRNDEDGCNSCVHSLGNQHVFLDSDNEKKYSVHAWRTMWGNFFADTVDVFEVFSESSRKIFAQVYPAVTDKIKLIPHSIPSFRRCNIAILGHLSTYKGSEVVRQLCQFADDNHIADMQLYLFGLNVENVVSSHLTETGLYERYELAKKLKKYEIDLVFIPSTCPETFCYTAGEAIALGYPVACFDLGGQADQVRNSDKGIILYEEDPLYLYKIFRTVCDGLKTSVASDGTAKNDAETKTVVIQDKSSRDFLDWMYKQRDDKSHFVPEAEDSIKRTDQMPKVIVAYLPQFHDFPENVKWFGKGFSEWTNSSQTLPQFLGHRQPHTPIDVGFYNLNTSQIMHRQAELAKKYGITGFCVYYYWFSGKKLMDRPLKHILEDKSLDFPFFLFWANDDWTMAWGNGATREVLYRGNLVPKDAELFMEDVLPYMKDPRYIRIGNKPVLLIYKIALTPKGDYLEFVERIQKIAVNNGFDGLYLLSPIEDFMDHENLEGVQEEYKLDALMEFHPIAGRKGWNIKHEDFFDPAYRSTCYDVDDFVKNRRYLLDTRAKVFPGLFPDWDNSPRRYNRGAWILQSSPENYKQWLSDLIQWTKEHNGPDEQFIFVNAWNEWAEGAHLEPDTYYGYAYLQQTRDALEEASCKKTTEEQSS